MIVKNIFCTELLLLPSSLLKIAEENVQKRQFCNPVQSKLSVEEKACSPC
jgi:hypothetical protein